MNLEVRVCLRPITGEITWIHPRAKMVTVLQVMKLAVKMHLLGKSEAETAHRRKSDSDSLASVEIEMESSRDNSEFGSPSKTGKRPHDIETPKNTECESQRSRLDQGSRWAHLRHQMLEGGFILVKRCYIMSPTFTTCRKVTL